MDCQLALKIETSCGCWPVMVAIALPGLRRKTSSSHAARHTRPQDSACAPRILGLRKICDSLVQHQVAHGRLCAFRCAVTHSLAQLAPTNPYHLGV